MTSPTSALLDGPAPISGRAVQRSFLWLAGSLATAGGIFGLATLMSAQNAREAGRMVIAAQQGTGYVAALTTGYAANHGRPYRY